VAETVFPKEGGKSVAGFMDLARKNGAQFVLCATSMDLHGLKPEDMIADVPAMSVADALPYLEAVKRIVSF
ncbi:MAG: DsrE/DsrF/DrsH-like family protein, partial [Burkholderiales bacterium]